MNKIKILYGLEAAGGGALKHVIYLATRLNTEKFEIHLLLSNIRLELNETDVKKLKSSNVKLMFYPLKQKINIFFDLIALIKIYKHIKKEEYDVVHAHSSKAGAIFRIAAWLNNVQKIFYTPHCFYFQGEKGFKRTIFKFIEKALSVVSTAIIVSESEKKQIIENRITNINKIININNAIDFNEYHQNLEVEKTKKELGIKNGNIVVGAIGRLVKQKDWITYIYSAKEVIKKYKDVTFLIVGNGEDYSNIKALVERLDLGQNIILTGYIENIGKIYGITDIFVNTSLWEGLPYVLLEAMKYEIPIVTTNVGNENVVIHEETGFIGPVKDINYISEKILALIENKQLAYRMGEKGNELLTRKYSFEYFIKQHECIYENFGK